MSYESILNAFSEEPHMCEDFFGMLTRIMKQAPMVMLSLNKFD